ncbi:MAG: amidohydrolase [Anaerolineaceae bacterium]|nr:amidohydrolase [Anaerolineaceae bacterium]
MVVIDSHTHIGLETFLAEPIPQEKRSRPAFQDRMENAFEDLIARMDANGVQKAIAFGFPLKEIDRIQANDYVLAAQRAYPDRIIPFALVGDDVEDWLQQGARGFKQQNILYAPERFDLIRAYSIMAEAGVPMLIHFRAGEGFSVTEQAKAILRQVPHLKLIVAHMGRNTPNTSDKVEAALLGLRDESNVIFETSTVRDPAIIARAVELVGINRVVFGSDYPFNSYQDSNPLAEEIGVIQRADLSAEARTRILGFNIQQFLNGELL